MIALGRDHKAKQYATSTLAGVEGFGKRTGASYKQDREVLLKKRKASVSLSLSFAASLSLLLFRFSL